MLVRMTAQLTGCLNDRPWPPVGAQADVDEPTALKLCAAGVATTVADDDIGVHSSCADWAAAARQLIVSGDIGAADALIRRAVHHYAHPPVELFTEATRLEPL